ncbi:TonB-dependent receptor [Geotalea uraniireducens]|uniref:TonB-dependent receptor n=1 Tax=Geotalea uraniireducens TaxID=351604 RepID=A0ABM8ELH6_9BACT|nr:energy transducer TonB [Geotalea uraniireducens]BDV43285.1 TonB-dependent receptor [Geotalea uraniireducens]
MNDFLFPQRQTHKEFAGGVIASLAIHTAIFASLFVLSQHVSRTTTTQALFIDMSNQVASPPPGSPSPTQAKPIVAPSRPEPMAMAASDAAGKTSPPEQPVQPTDEAIQPTSRPAADPFSLGLSRGYFQTIGDGTTLRNDIRDYYMRMLQQINERWWENGTPSSGSAKGEIFLTVTLNRSGEILGINLLQGSGNIDYDRKIIDAVRRASPLPPVPDGYRGEFFQAPLRLVAPLGLLSQQPARSNVIGSRTTVRQIAG